jgi:S-adenosylmethionine decarboxylase
VLLSAPDGLARSRGRAAFKESFHTVKSKLKLHGFNNLTKTLSFNIYDICYAETPEDQQAYVQYINEEYDAARLTQILTDVVDIIGANILNIARQDYEPQGASVTILISEQPVIPTESQIEESPGPLPDTILAHLDKSHITVHTYPEIHPVEGIATFRVDIDVSTCGVISPLKALNYLIHQFDSDIVTVDYRVRGFTRDIEGQKHFIDHENYLSDDTQAAYQMTDVNVYQENLFHTKMLLKDFELENYLFGDATRSLSAEQRAQVEARVKHEMLEIFYGRNMTR